MINKTLESRKGEEENGRATKGVRLPDNVAGRGMEGAEGQTGRVLSSVSEGVRGEPVRFGGLAGVSESSIRNGRTGVSQNDSRGNRGEQRNQGLELGKNSGKARKTKLERESGGRERSDNSQKQQILVKLKEIAEGITRKYNKKNKIEVIKELKKEIEDIFETDKLYVNDKAEMALVYLAEARRLDAKHGLIGKDSVFLNLLVNENGTASDVMHETISYASHTNRRSNNELMSSNEIGAYRTF